MSSEYEEPSELFEKPRGERRWLGREHHRGKEQMYNAVKGRTFIEKTFSAKEPMSKNATAKLNASTKDGLEPNVVYSLDKKNRWRDADTIRLLGAAPEEVNAEVVEKNVIDASTFSVSSRVVEDGGGGGGFGVRRATSSGKGQHYSNFTAKSRELSEKKKKEKRTEEEEEEEEEEGPPTVSYNIYKTHRSLEAVGGQMFKAKVVGKSGRHRANRKIDMEVYEEEDFEEEEEEEEEEELERRADKVMDLTDYLVEPREKQASRRKDSEMSYEIIEHEALDPEPRYTDLLDIHTFLRDEGHTFEQTDVTFHNQKDNMHHQLGQLQKEKGLKVADLRPEQYLVDASEWCQLDDGDKDGETTTVIVISHLKKNQYNIIVNSTIPKHPSKRGSEYLKSQISSAMTIREAISRITTELMTARKIIETMKLSCSFYNRKSLPEMLHDSHEWENQLLDLPWPNKYYHASWANSQELSTMGSAQEWADLCEMVKGAHRTGRTCYTASGDACGVCSRPKSTHELFLTTDEVKIKCSDCLRDEFYKEMRARRVPIDLALDVADELEYLPTFIPLPVLNLYVRMVAELIYKDAGATGSFEKCPSCKAALYFEVGAPHSKCSQNRACPCGYSWCRHCDRVPHWPMGCGEFAEWEEKWLLRYSMMYAQGTGSETLMQVTCSCKKAIYFALLPEPFIECPKCKITVNMHTMNTVYRHYYFPYDPRFRKIVEQGYFETRDYYDQSAYVPQKVIYTKIAKIPGIRASVMETCATVRDVRFDVNTRNRAVNKEHVLIRKGVLEAEEVENAMGTVAYLAETVTAWMHVTTAYDRSVKRTLERMMESRKTLVEVLETDDAAKIRECLAAIRRDIDTVLVAVEKKIHPI